MANDGTTALVGAPGDGSNGEDSGSAFVFERATDEWRRQAILTADDLPRVQGFGARIVLSGDSTTAVIGVHDLVEDSEEPGAFVFERTNEGWRQQAALTGEGSTNFWSSLAVSDDGTTVMLGAPYAGSVYVFEQTDGGWGQVAELVAEDGDDGDAFGAGVAVSGDGTTTIIGATGFGDPDRVPQVSGSAFVFERTTDGWNQRAKLTPADGDHNDQFGIPVVSNDGTTAVVGARNDRAAYVFEPTDGEWSQQTKLIPEGSTDRYDGLGEISVSRDGSIVMIGRPEDENPNGVEGSANVFVRTSEEWSQQTTLVPEDGTDESGVGMSTAMSSDGTTAIVGAPGDMAPNGESTGSAYVYE